MIELLPDIFHTASDRPFANEVETRAYLVTLAAGNLLFYGYIRNSQRMIITSGLAI